MGWVIADNPATDAALADMQTQVDGKAPLDSPAFTGTPTAPTPTGSSGVATKGYVDTHGGGDVSGPGSSVDLHLARFSGTSGMVLADAGVVTDTDGTLAADSDGRLATQKAAKTYVDTGLTAEASARNTAITTQIDALIGGAPGALDTLNELAAALGDDANFAATVTSSLAGKQPLDAKLTAFAGLSGVADELAYFTGTTTLGTTPFTSFARTLLGDPDQNGALGTLAALSAADRGQWRTTRLATWRAALANRATAPAKIAFIQDSLGEEGRAFKHTMRELCARYAGPTQLESPHIYGGMNADNLYWPFTLGGSASRVNGVGYAAEVIRLGAGDTLTENPTSPFTGIDAQAVDYLYDRVRINYRAGTGTATVTIDGVSAGTINVASGRHFDSGQLTPGPHTIVITGASGTVDIEGIYHYHGNYTTGVQCHMISRVGFTSADFRAMCDSGAPATAHIPTPNTDLYDYLVREGFHAVVFCTVTNDTDETTYNTNMTALMTRVRAGLASASFGMWIVEPNLNHAWIANVPPLARALADAQGAVLVDQSAISPAHTTVGSDTLGLTGDGVHYTDIGNEFASRLMLEVLDGPPRAKAVNYADANNGGRASLYQEGTGGSTIFGYGVNPTPTSAGRPPVLLGYNASLFSTGLFGGPNLTIGLVPTSSAWTLLNSVLNGKTAYTSGDGAGGLYDYDSGGDGSHAIVGSGSKLLTSQAVPNIMIGYDRTALIGGAVMGSDGTNPPDTFFAYLGSGIWSTLSARITGLPTSPSDRSDAIARGYTDQMIRIPCRVVTLSNLASAYANGTAGVAATLTATSNGAAVFDGVAMALGDRVLVATQTSTFQQGIYTVTTVGDGTHPWVLTRSTAFDEVAEMSKGASVFVTEGSLSAGTRWWCKTLPATIGTDPIIFAPENLGTSGLRGFSNFGIGPAIGFAADDGSPIDASISRLAAGALTVVGSLAGNSFLGSSSASAGVGYATGAGGAVNQATNKSTGVTLNKITGQITMNGAALAASTSVGFTLTNSAIAANDVVQVSIKSGATANSYTVTVDAVAAGSCHIHIRNISAGSLSEALVLQFAVLKGVTS